MPRLQWLQFFRLHIYGISKWLLTQLTRPYSNSACAHVHSTCTSYAYLYCIYALVGGPISIRDLYICAVHESVPTNRTLSSTAHCLCCENVAIGFKTSIEAYFVEKKNSAKTPELLEVSKLCYKFLSKLFFLNSAKIKMVPVLR